MKSRFLSICIIVALGGFLSACASGSKFQDLQAQGAIGAPAKQQARVYFYRNQVLGAAIQPVVHLNGEPLRRSQPNGFFYKDVTPGTYRASVTTEVENSIEFKIGRGENKYVRIDPSFGVFVGRMNPTLIEEQQAKQEIQEMSLIQE